MLFRNNALAGLADGTISLAFRRWRQPRVKAGSRLRTAIGVLEVERVERVEPEALTLSDAVGAGFGSLAELRAMLAEFRDGDTYRVYLKLAGPDPRVALREDATLSEPELHRLAQRLERLDRASRSGPWTRAVLTTIASQPGVRAADLAAAFGRERDVFKTDVRKLKELGLTESLEVGYRLSPRGQAVLEHLEAVSLPSPTA
jgi:hypothetical protein